MAEIAGRRCTAFQGSHFLKNGTLVEVALAVRAVEAANESDPVLIFDDATGFPFDLDLRGTEEEIRARYAASEQEKETSPTPLRGRGRPKLGVVAREVTLLPRHWEWLNAQPGGASVALRKLVEAARHANPEKDLERRAHEAAYHFLSAIAGNLAGFEEASRALFANDLSRFEALIAAWPVDIREHAMKLATGKSLTEESRG